MPKIVINNIAELKILQSKLRALKNVFPQLQKQALQKTSNEDILEDIHQEMRANDVSEKIIDATFVGRTEIFGNISRTHFISNYVSETGFDVSNAREEGTTQPNPIRPKREGGSLKIPIPGGGEIFRKLSRPNGMPRLLIIERTLKKAENTALAGYRDNLASAISKFLGV